MITLDLQGLNKARIWFEPNSKLLIEKHSKNAFYKFESSHSNECQDRTIILELFLPRGARIIYGVLGINYKYMADKLLTIKVPATNNDLKMFDDSLIAPLEKANIGLPLDYGKEIFLELARLHKVNKLLLTGEIDFCYAVHSEASSSSWIFQKLTYILINLSLIPRDIVNRETLIELLELSRS